jgi:phospho-N-acetylmuramoyl-pentapeptide-transferase
MFYYISQWLLDWSAGTEWAGRLSFLRLFSYITFRSAGAAITALLVSLWWGPRVIRWLKELKFGQEYKDKAEEAGDIKTRLLKKTGTPTMGGILIVMVLNFTTLLWAQWNMLIGLTLLPVLVLCALGFYDDYAKITKQTSGGATAAVKLIVQFAVALFIAIYLWKVPSLSKLVTEIMVPFYKYPVATGAALIGILITVFAIVGSSNAVNLTDGLDGLAIGCTLIVTIVFLVLTYICGHAEISKYLQVTHVVGAGELTVFCAALFGAGLGFLWFNCHPAQVFMGDTGSLALGGGLGIVAVLIHQPLILMIAGGVFVMEAGSVILQRGWFKYTKRKFGEGRRIFLMSPIHHHFEKKGWYESQVVMRFYILCVLFAVIALSTLKIR